MLFAIGVSPSDLYKLAEADLPSVVFSTLTIQDSPESLYPVGAAVSSNLYVPSRKSVKETIPSVVPFVIDVAS